MSRLEALKEKRAAVLDRWKELTLAVYEDRAAEFIVRENDRFRNPVGHLVRENLALLYDGLLEDAPAEKLRLALDGILRVRAVQDLSPSTAVAFVLQLKRAIRDVMSEDHVDPQIHADVTALSVRIDRLALAAFDVYTHCREQIFELRLSEIRGRAPRSLSIRRAREMARPSEAGSERTGPETEGGCAG